MHFFQTWIIGKWATPREQYWAPSGTHFHQFVVPPIIPFRRDCTYGKLAAMKLPDEVEGLGSCEVINYTLYSQLTKKIKTLVASTYLKFRCENRALLLTLFILFIICSIHWNEAQFMLAMLVGWFIFLKGGNIMKLGQSTLIRLILCGRPHSSMDSSHYSLYYILCFDVWSLKDHFSYFPFQMSVSNQLV